MRPEDWQAYQAGRTAGTAANGGVLTAATDIEYEVTEIPYVYDGSVYEKRVYNGYGNPKPSEDLRFGPNIKDWPRMHALEDDLLLKLCAVIQDEVTTTDELIPSGETSSYRSNPIKLSEFALSRRYPQYVESSKKVLAMEQLREQGGISFEAAEALEKLGGDIAHATIGSCIFARKPGDGSAREQAASCQKVLGGWANIAQEYATKRYRSNLINWGILPFLIEGEPPFANDGYIFIPNIREAVEKKAEKIKAYAIGDAVVEFDLALGDLTDDERTILTEGCLINYYKSGN